MNKRIRSLTFFAVPSRLVITVAMFVMTNCRPAPAPSNWIVLTTASIAGMTLLRNASTNLVRIGMSVAPIVSCASVRRSRMIANLPANVSAATAA